MAATITQNEVQIVNHWANDIDFKFGPFVVVYNHKNNMFWPAAKMEGHICGIAVTLHPSIINLLKKNKFDVSGEDTTRREELIRACAWLNKKFAAKNGFFNYQRTKYGGGVLVVANG